MIKCPHCFTPVPPVPAGGWCVEGTCDSPAIAAALAWRPVRRGDAEPWPLSCGQGLDGHGEVCPTCEYRMAPRWREAATTCVVLAGAIATGKSIYIGVLIKQLEQCGEWLRLRVRPADADVERMFRDVYETPLYKERGVMQATRRAFNTDAYQHQPLVYELSTVGGRRHHLVIRDVSGEDLEQSPLDRTHLGFFARADGVIYLFDPLQVEDIRDKLSNLIPHSDAHRVQGDPVRVLDSTLALIGQARPKLAVVMSKFDAVQSLREVQRSYWSQIMGNAGAAFFRDPGPLAPYDDLDGQLLHEEVRSLLQMLQSGMVTALEAVRQRTAIPYRYFAVSALGDPPQGNSLNARGIAPFRCLDPLRWILADSGVL